MKIAMAQMQMGPTAEENLNKTLQRMKRAAALDAELIFFPAQQLSLFSADAPLHGLRADGEELEAIRQCSAALGLAASANILPEEGGSLSLMIGADGALLGTSRTSCPDAGADGAFPVYDVAGVRVGVVIDGDRHRPESVRACARGGAELVIIPAASRKGEPLWYYERELCALAVLNCCFIALCSRVGQEGEQRFAGHSMLAGPDGRILLKAGSMDGLYVVDFDPAEARSARANCAWLGGGQAFPA